MMCYSFSFSSFLHQVAVKCVMDDGIDEDRLLRMEKLKDGCMF